MPPIDELNRRTGIHRTYAVYEPEDLSIDPFIQLELELVVRGKIVLSIPVWRYKNHD